MADVATFDSTNDPVVLESIQADEAESLAIGKELMEQQNELLAGKYKNAQDLEKAYIELQQKLGSQDSAPEKAEESTEEKPETADEAVDFLWKVNDEYEKNDGKLSEATMEEFSKMSSKELVEAFFRYQDTVEKTEAPQGVELTDQQISEVQNFVGGEAKYQELVTWASENFSEEEVNAFDSVVETGNIPAIRLALQALQYRYQDSVGVDGNMLQGKPAQPRDVFRSQSELVRAMSDPKYDNDPAYRMDVIEKLGRSNLQF